MEDKEERASKRTWLLALLIIIFASFGLLTWYAWSVMSVDSPKVNSAQEPSHTTRVITLETTKPTQIPTTTRQPLNVSVMTWPTTTIPLVCLTETQDCPFYPWCDCAISEDDRQILLPGVPRTFANVCPATTTKLSPFIHTNRSFGVGCWSEASVCEEGCCPCLTECRSRGWGRLCDTGSEVVGCTRTCESSGYTWLTPTRILPCVDSSGNDLSPNPITYEWGHLHCHSQDHPEFQILLQAGEVVLATSHVVDHIGTVYESPVTSMSHPAYMPTGKDACVLTIEGDEYWPGVTMLVTTNSTIANAVLQAKPESLVIVTNILDTRVQIVLGPEGKTSMTVGDGTRYSMVRSSCREVGNGYFLGNLLHFNLMGEHVLVEPSLGGITCACARAVCTEGKATHELILAGTTLWASYDGGVTSGSAQNSYDCQELSNLCSLNSDYPSFGFC